MAVDGAGVGSYIESAQKLATTGIDLFTLPEIEASLIAGTSITIYPQNAINDTGPYDFLIPSDDNDYTFLPVIFLHLRTPIKLLLRLTCLLINMQKKGIFIVSVTLKRLWGKKIILRLAQQLNQIQLLI